MALAMDLHLLKERFPEDPSVDNCGNLKNVFFCARNVNTHLREGRLYVTERALFFVSSFSSSVTYDVSIKLSDITEALFPRKVIPTMELQLTEDKECFANFHNLEKILDMMKSLVPDKVKVETAKSGVFPNFNRLISVPGENFKNRHKADPCPYFMRCGFCPRKDFCNLSHGPHTAVFPAMSSRTLPHLLTKHTSPDKTTTQHLLPAVPGPDLLRSISLPACEGGMESPFEEEKEGDNDQSEGERTPSPVSKLNTAKNLTILQQLSVKGPPLFNFGEQEDNIERKFASNDIFSISNSSPPPPVPSDLEGYQPIPSKFAAAFYEGEEYDEEDIPYVEIPTTMSVFPASHIQRSDINSGDKAILPSGILAACEQRQITYPMAFRFKSRSSDSFVHTGVLEFTSPLENTAYLPQWMYDHLNVSEGEEVDFEYIDLPKGTFVQLQPVSSSWLGVPYDKRTAILEFQLRNFQTLTEGTKVTIVYELNRYTFKVLQCKPAKGISIVDSDLTTDVVEPADLNRFHSVEEWQAENILLSEPLQCSTVAGSYRHFVLLSCPGKELPPMLRVEVKHDSGDPDLFLCQTCSTPSRSRYTWCNQAVGGSVIHLSSSNGDYDQQKSVYAGVISLSEDSQFTICFSEEEGNDATTGGGTIAGHVLRPTTNNNTSSTGNGASLEDQSGNQSEATDSPVPIPPDHQKCSCCGIVMPQLKLLMHERHCAQSMFTCPVCNERFPKSMEKKHELIAHQLLQCDCGEELSQIALHEHQMTQCLKRSVKCQFKWCQLSFPLDQLQDHESVCGRKMVNCPVCSVEVSHLELEIHLEVFHQVEVAQLDWSKPLASQFLPFKSKEPKYKCHCGLGFEFEDDLQVHQLTECTTPNDSDQFIG